MKYADEIPSVVMDKLAELVDIIEEDNQTIIDSYIVHSKKWEEAYYMAINNPCKHKSTRVEKGDKLRFICNCCEKVVDEYDDFSSALEGKK